MNKEKVIYLYNVYCTIYTIKYTGYYSALKQREILPFVTTWRKLEDIMRSEISQMEEDKYCLISPTCRI